MAAYEVVLDEVGVYSFYYSVGFVDKAGGDYHLSVGSPCRRAGRFEPWMRKAVDFDGRKRSAGGQVDIGCYQDSSVGLMLLVR